MIEELKLVLDSVGDLTGIALWIVGFFIGYKLIVYLSLTGSIVFIAKLVVTKAHDVFTKRYEFESKGFYIGTDVDEIDQREVISDCRSEAIKINTLLQEYKSTSYFHLDDLRRLKNALELGLIK